jgi:hypothetical protein
MHKVQYKILKKLIENDKQRYSELYKGFSEEDKFAYHLKYLVRKKLVLKVIKTYSLTKEGEKAFLLKEMELSLSSMSLDDTLVADLKKILQGRKF